jgi:2-iminobutanoate/2-iminopropanoate deaminase
MNTFTVEHIPQDSYSLTRAFSPGVITQGGKTVWIAGQTATIDKDGQDISNDFEKQVNQVMYQIDSIMKKAGGNLSNVVQMTVFIKESRYSDLFVELRKNFFETGKYPASALLTITNFVRPGIEIEIQSVGVIGDSQK